MNPVATAPASDLDPMYEFAVTPAVTQLRRQGVIITEVAIGGLGDELELQPGDRIVRVNGRPVRDYLDLRFQTAGETELTFQVKRASGETLDIEFDRDEGEDFGLEFEQIVPRQCANECLFCFCKGNPSDARPSLFVRDEDIRLSFLYGNYTTLSSITEDEMRRVIEQRLSPQYVSVHATDLKTRAYLLGVDESKADVWAKLRRMLDAGVEIHAQIVLCPGINDGEILKRTISDLAAEYPRIISAAVVPVALTEYNTDERLTRVTPDFCRETVRNIEVLQKEFRRTLGTTFVFLGDEIYIKGGLEIPSRRHYGNYPQIEDGVGMVRSFLNIFEKMLKRRDADPLGSRNVRTHPNAALPRTKRPSDPPINKKLTPNAKGTLLTGEMFAPILREQIGRFNRLKKTRLDVVAVPNRYFGGDVSVAGLLSGSDLLGAADRVKGDFVVIPRVTIKSDDPVFIDGMSYEELKRRFPVPLFDLDIDGLIKWLST